MHHVLIKRPLTMPSGPKAALDYLSMLQLAAKNHGPCENIGVQEKHKKLILHCFYRHLSNCQTHD